MKLVSTFLCVCVFSWLNLNGQTTILLNDETTEVQDAVIGSLPASTNYGDLEYYSVYSWTQQGSINIVRYLMAFDLDALPPNIKITEAKLLLFYGSQNDVKVNSGENEFYVQRIMEPWDQFETTWNNQPISTETNRVLVPKGTKDREDYEIDVTDLVVDMLEDSMSFGFILQHVVEEPYKASYFASSKNEDPSVRPGLLITYTSTVSVNENEESLSIYPNPSQDYLIVEGLDNQSSDIEVFDITGRIMDIDVKSLSNNAIKLDLRNLKSGKYMIKSQLSNRVHSFIKE